MILPSRRSRLPWAFAILVAAAATALYALSRDGAAPAIPGATASGLALGLLALALILVLLAFGWRKRAYRSTLGTLDGWLQTHLALGVVVVWVALLHAGFRFQDRLATLAFWVLVAVVVTGLWGARAYATLPRRLTRVAGDATPDEVSRQINQLSQTMDRLAAGRSASFRSIARRLARRVQPETLAGWRLLAGVGDTPTDDDRVWSRLVSQVDEDEHASLRRLLILARQQGELLTNLRRQLRYRNLLRAWLFLHLPLSFGLLVLVLAHVVAALYHGAWPPGGP